MSDQSIVELMRSGVPLQPRDTATVGRAVAHQLVSAHDQGVAHGDVGPHTVFLTMTEQGQVAGATLIGPHSAQRPSNWLGAPAQGAGAAQLPEDVFALGQLMRALDAYASPGASVLPLIVPSMVADDPARRPTMQDVLEAIGQEAPPVAPLPTLPPLVDPAAPTMPRPVASVVTPADAPPAAAPPHPRARRAPVVLGLVAALLVVAAAGGAYWWFNQTDDTPTTLHSAEGRNDLVGPEDGAHGVGDDGTGDDGAEGDGADVEGTAEDLTQEPVDHTGAESDSSADVAQPDTSGGADDTSGTAGDTSGTGDEGAGAAPTTPADSSPALPVPGSDAAAFDAAYCRDRGTFVALADTSSFRAIICDSYGSLTYHGLNRGDGLTITTGAVETSSGWSGTVAGGGSYDVSRSEVRVMQGSTTLASEAVHTFVDSSDFGTFRPGDLDLTQQISFPECDGAGVVVLDSFVGGDVAEEVQASLDRHAGASYLRTDLSCDNFNRPSSSTGGAVIYATYLWVGHDKDSVCEMAESHGTYAYWLRDGVESGHTIDCS